MNLELSPPQPRFRAFTLVELIVLIALVAVVMGMLILPTRPRPTRAPRIKCINNLKNISLAFRLFATDNEDRFPMQVSTNEGGALEFTREASAYRVFVALSNELSTPNILYCPSDSRRRAATNFTSLRDANLSYFIVLNTTAALTNAFLSGDRNLTTNGVAVTPGVVDLTTNLTVGWTSEMHNKQGNVAMGDGSVQQFSTTRIGAASRSTVLGTNRLVVP
jgi:prepilin-type processing-associated H-X9-DG protein